MGRIRSVILVAPIFALGAAAAGTLIPRSTEVHRDQNPRSAQGTVPGSVAKERQPVFLVAVDPAWLLAARKHLTIAFGFGLSITKHSARCTLRISLAGRAVVALHIIEFLFSRFKNIRPRSDCSCGAGRCLQLTAVTRPHCAKQLPKPRRDSAPPPSRAHRHTGRREMTACRILKLNHPFRLRRV